MKSIKSFFKRVKKLSRYFLNTINLLARLSKAHGVIGAVKKFIELLTFSLEDADREFNRRLSRHMSPETGHETYVKLIEKLEEEEIIGEIEDEFVYIQGEDILADYKRPTSPKELQSSVATYLRAGEPKVKSIRFSQSGFLSPPDYEKFLGKVIRKSNCDLNDYTLETEFEEEENKIVVRFYSEEQSFEQKFERGSEYFEERSLKPVSRALRKECSQNICLKTPYLMILEEAQFEAIKQEIGEFITPVI